MGLFGDIIGKVGLEYRAEVEQAKAKVRELAGEQKKQAAAAAEGLEAQARAHDLMVTRVTAAIGIVVSAYAVARQGLKTYEENTRLAGASAGIQIEALRKASGGLRNDTELLRTAVDGLNGRWQLSQKEIELVLRGMRGLVAQGREEEKVVKAVGDAIRKGEVEPLKELGVLYDVNVAKVDKKRAALEALGRAGSGNLDMVTDASKRFGVSLENALDNIQHAIGQVVTAAVPVVEQFTEMARLLGNIASGIGAIVSYATSLPGAPGGGGGPGGISLSDAKWLLPHYQLQRGVNELVAYSTQAPQFADWRTLTGESQADFAARMRQMELTDPDTIARNRRLAEAERKMIQAARERQMNARNTLLGLPGVNVAQNLIGGFIDDPWKGFGPAARGGGRRRAPGPTRWDEMRWAFDEARRRDEFLMMSAGDTVEGESFGAWSDFEEQGPTTAQKNLAAIRESARQLANIDFDQMLRDVGRDQEESFLMRVFGPIEEFNAYAAGFGTLTTSVKAAFQAWIDGSMSAGKAFKQAAAQQLGAQAVELIGLSITSGAWGFYHLATGNPKGAGELAASGKALAGATALGLLAKSLGGNAVGAQSGVGASAAGVGGGGRELGAGAARNITIVHGDGQAEDSPRWRARRVERDLATWGRHYQQPDGSYQG